MLDEIKRRLHIASLNRCASSAAAELELRSSSGMHYQKTASESSVRWNLEDGTIDLTLNWLPSGTDDVEGTPTTAELCIKLDGSFAYGWGDDVCQEGCVWTWNQLGDWLDYILPVVSDEVHLPQGINAIGTVEEMLISAEDHRKKLSLDNTDGDAFFEEFEEYQWFRDVVNGLGIILPPLWVTRDDKHGYVISQNQIAAVSADILMYVLGDVRAVIMERASAGR